MAEQSTICTNCGKPLTGHDGNQADKTVWAVYADKPNFREEDAFPLHQKCFKDNDTVTTQRWVGEKFDQLEDYTFTRYRQVKG